ncbi:23S rRNA (pseudouridine(1915)-N(3))-methyltransferase RlmH [Govanella unica]|uniref:Ribosomal RNA large subunit methyltransferase H n=1 Tax=Govanella unica TaxID=2975056 RepID=A0A9X3Z6C0_9PROT|nr:23S rRNA (pseudouridine(1915)-N(3))-methyltransferase RlmH [Govania unica]MDA5192769.1 23S rRNA (pseudouridine(1915)-N(3))-methyltransferase RlmH [Govania unica]
MDVTVVAVGRLRSGPEHELISAYLKRLPWTLRIIEVEERRPIVGPERQTREADLILAALPPGAIVIALDERGKTLSSMDFSTRLTGWRDAAKPVAFVIGGADGLHEKIRTRADLLLGLGPMVWPHAMVRVMLTEQIYRAYTIATGHPYHK